jgi:lysozyme
MTILGIDISWCQGSKLDHAQIKDAGIGFVIAKCTHGQDPKAIDPTFARNWSETKRVGQRRGAYHWFVPEHDPIAQADHFVDTLGPLDINDLPPSFDFEQQTKILGKALLDRALACVERIEELTMRRVLLYTGSWYWRGFALDLDHPLASRPLWHAQYPSTLRQGKDYEAALAHLPDPSLPKPWKDRGESEVIWQFDGDHGLVLPDGTDSDFDRFHGDESDLDAFVRGSHLPIPHEVGLLLGNDGPPHDPYVVDRAESELADTDPPPMPTEAPPITDPQSPTARSSQRIAAVVAPICTCEPGESIEAVTARSWCAVHGGSQP